MDHYEPSGHGHTPLMEAAIAEGTAKVFTTSKLLRDKLPFKAEAIGLPNPFAAHEPIINDKILFNHRITIEKRPEKLELLPTEIRKRVIITSPVEYDGPDWWKARLGEYQINLDDVSYETLLHSCGFGISFACHDTWGMSAIEGILSGALYLMPNDPRTAYPEIHIPELLYTDINDLVDILEYYGDNTNTEERIDVVKKAQENLKEYAPDVWLDHLLKKLR